MSFYTGWFLGSIGFLLVILGAGLYLLTSWARRVTIAVVSGSAVTTVVVVGWAISHARWDVVAAGLGKVPVEIGLCHYLLQGAKVPFGSQPNTNED